MLQSEILYVNVLLSGICLRKCAASQYLLPILYLPPMAGALPSRSGIDGMSTHMHTFEYSTIILECTYELVHLTIKTVLIGSQ